MHIRIVLIIVCTYSITTSSESINVQINPSQNFDQRITKNNLAVQPKFIIMHYTANCDKQSALTWLKNKLNPVSAHFVIGPDGTISQTVHPDNRAWHAGSSSWHNVSEMNTYSIGIELVNPGFTQEKKDPCPQTSNDPWDINSGIQKSGSDGYWYPFTKAQIEQLIHLCQALIKKYNIPAHHVLGHSDIAPQRKSDPGPLFPWKYLAQKGIGIWYNDIQQAPDNSLTSIQTMLKKFGYKLKISSWLDKPTQDVLKAFQMHFRPSNINGQPDQETANIVYTLLSQHPQAIQP